MVLFAGLAIMAPTAAAQQQYPPLSVEVSADHPLFLFEAAEIENGEGNTGTERIAQRWSDLPDELRPFSALCISIEGPGLAARHERT
ncbi:MAG: hypothetical protein R6V12_10160, partial [Candidatus Hydrogenedentota bacterium]